MTPQEEFKAAVEHLEELAGKLALLTMGLKRLADEMRDETPRSDFDYRTGMRPEK